MVLPALVLAADELTLALLSLLLNILDLLLLRAAAVYRWARSKTGYQEVERTGSGWATTDTFIAGRGGTNEPRQEHTRGNSAVGLDAFHRANRMAHRSQS